MKAWLFCRVWFGFILELNQYTFQWICTGKHPKVTFLIFKLKDLLYSALKSGLFFRFWLDSYWFETVQMSVELLL
jgi:hypothetical protein